MESIQRTRGTRVRASRTAMKVGLEKDKGSEGTKKGKEEEEEGQEGADPPETNGFESIVVWSLAADLRRK